MAAVTSNDRTTRMKDWLLTKSAPQNAISLKPGSNLLLASTIHGLARRSKGHKLTEIENKGVQLFKVFAESEDELNSYGSICAEAKAAARAKSFVAMNAPTSIMELADDTPLTQEQFYAEIKELGEETVRQPHIRAVQAGQVQPDGEIPATPGFAEASKVVGRGLTMFLGSSEGDRKSGGVVGPRLGFHLIPREFHCIRKSGESGHDEVYFTWGFGDDGDDKSWHKTGEFGSVSSGSRREFPTPPWFHSGQPQKCCTGTIICWEADHSSSEWREKLRLAMSELAELARSLCHDVGNNALNELIGQLPGFSEYADLMFWIENIATLIAALIDWLKNKDDKVKENSYGWSREYMEEKGTHELTLDFNGGSGGHHRVYTEFFFRESEAPGGGIGMGSIE